MSPAGRGGGHGPPRRNNTGERRLPSTFSGLAGYDALRGEGNTATDPRPAGASPPGRTRMLFTSSARRPEAMRFGFDRERAANTPISPSTNSRLFRRRHRDLLGTARGAIINERNGAAVLWASCCFRILTEMAAFGSTGVTKTGTARSRRCVSERAGHPGNTPFPIWAVWAQGMVGGGKEAASSQRPHFYNVIIAMSPEKSQNERVCGSLFSSAFYRMLLAVFQKSQLSTL